MRDWFYRISLVVVGVFVLYLLIFRAFIAWVQFAPEKAVSFVETMTHSTIKVEDINIKQTWAGIRFKVKQLQFGNKTSHLTLEQVKGDFNIFAPWIPHLRYGQQLELKGLKLTFKNLDTKTWFSSEDSESKPFNVADLRLPKIWKSIKIENAGFTFNQGKPFNVNIKFLQSYLGLKWAVVGLLDFSSESGVSNELQLKGDFSTNVWNIPEEGEGAISIISPIRLTDLYPFFPESLVKKLPTGEMVGDFKFTLSDGRIKTLKTYATVQDLTWIEHDKLLPKSIGLTLNLHSKGDFIGKQYSDWVFELEKIRFDDQYVKTISPVLFSLTKNENLAFKASRFKLHEIKPLFDLALNSLEYQGFGKDLKELELTDVKGVFNLSTGRLSRLDFNLPSIRLEQQKSLPGIVIKDLSFSKQDSAVQIKIGQPVQLLYDVIKPTPIQFSFSQPIKLQVGTLERKWNLTKTNFEMDDIPMSLTAHSESQGGVNAHLEMAPKTVEAVKSYLPYSIMAKPLSNWLKLALVKGDGVRAVADLNGKLSDFPFKNHEGSFKAIAYVDNMELKFQPNWPSVKDFSAKLEFTPYNLKITSPKASLLNVNASDVQVDIDNLATHNIAVNISGKAEGDASDAIAFLNQTPLTQKLGIDEFLGKQLEAHGRVHVNLSKVWVPVWGFDHKSESVKGSVALDGVDVDLFGQIPIKQATGQVLFTESAVSTLKNVQATYLNGPLELSVETLNRVIGIHVKGNARPENTYASGQVPWNLALNIPFDKSQPIDLITHADLNLVKSHLPAPLDESALNTLKSVNTLNAHLIIKGSIVRAQAQIGSVAKFATEWDTSQSTPKSLQLILGSDNQAYPLYTSNYSIEGKMKVLDFEGWNKLLAQVPPSEKPYSTVHWIESNLKLDKLLLKNYELHHLYLNWNSVKEQQGNKGHYLALKLKADEASLVLTKSDEDAFDVNMSYLKLQSKKELANSSSVAESVATCSVKDTAFKLPKIRFKGTNLNVDGRQIASLGFVLEDSSTQTLLSNLEVDFNRLNAKLKGSYRFDKQQQISYLSGDINADRVEQLAKLLGVHKGFQGKDGQLHMDLSWPGDYDCYSVLDLKGKIDFSLKDGVIKDAEPGLARIIGLLSFESLARRLRLDVKDVTNQGLSYDSIKGHGRFNKGVFGLESLELSAPAASAMVFGEINLVQKELSLKANITPAIGETIPAIVALSGIATPLAGLAAYALLKVVPLVNEDLVTYRYDVSGTFEKPIIKERGLDLDLIKLKGQSSIKSDSILDAQ